MAKDETEMSKLVEAFTADIQQLARNLQKNARTMFPQPPAATWVSELPGVRVGVPPMTPERRAAMQDKPLRPMTLRYAKQQLAKKTDRINHLREQLADLHKAHKREINRARTLDHSNLKLRVRVDELERRARERGTGAAPVVAPGDRIRCHIPPHEIELRIDMIEWHVTQGWTIKCSDIRPQAPGQTVLDDFNAGGSHGLTDRPGWGSKPIIPGT